MDTVKREIRRTGRGTRLQEVQFFSRVETRSLIKDRNTFFDYKEDAHTYRNEYL